MATLSEPVAERDHLRGQDNAPVILVEYGDYECPYSGQAHDVVSQIEEDLAGTVSFVYRNFPLTQIRPHALPAALAAEAAARQGRFWEMHDILFQQQERLESEYLIAFAQVLGLDLERFIIDMTSDDATARVREDFVGGIKSGVDGTPTFYINGIRHDGPYDYETLKAAIEKAAEQRPHSGRKTKAGVSRER
ncbi:MAG TPA: thioredoxin domain-containing protein [Candidatus Saccharimonadales bacterium]